MLDAVTVLFQVFKHHDEVRVIQPTWHCLLRFRQRVDMAAGTDTALRELRESLERADLTRMAPGWISGRDQGAQMWALDGDLAYPLSPGPRGVWTAATVLKRGAR
jgi:hypothetical protein